MRTVKFRGKRIDIENGEWVYGYFLYRRGGTDKNSDLISSAHLIFDERESFEVHPDTVGQSTGREDMFAGDRIEDNVGRTWFIDYCDEAMAFVFRWEKDPKQYILYSRFRATQLPLKIIGTIHDKEPK